MLSRPTGKPPPLRHKYVDGQRLTAELDRSQPPLGSHPPGRTCDRSTYVCVCVHRAYVEGAKVYMSRRRTLTTAANGGN